MKSAKEEKARGLTFEKWQQTLTDKYEWLKKTVNENMPEIWTGLEFELSILSILNIEGCTLPFIGIILGRPSSGKTQIINLLKKWPCTYYTDNFTARAFVSHSTAVSSKEELEEIDLLPKIRNKLFLTPELSPTFTAKDEDLNQLLGIITRIADGQGYQSDSGAHGHRGYDGELMFTWVGAAVDIPYKVYKVLGNLGSKLYFFRLPSENKSEDLLFAQMNDDFNRKINVIKGALFDYLKWFQICPSMVFDKSNGLSKMNWNSEKDDEQAKRYIVSLAVLLSRLRCVAKTWETEDSQGSDYAYSVSQHEDPSRAVTMLTNLAKGHALLLGRNYIIREDIPTIVKTVRSTAQIERVSLFSLLLENKGELDSQRVLESLNVSKPTALRTMAEFKAIGLVDRQDPIINGNKKVQITLKPEFRWFLSEEFIKLREGFTPSDNREYTNNKDENEENESTLHKEKFPLTTTSFSIDNTKVETFFRIFDELASQQPSTTTKATAMMEVDRNTVSGEELKKRLVSSNKFFAGDAFQIIEDMVKEGKIEKVAFDTYRRRQNITDDSNSEDDKVVSNL